MKNRIIAVLICIVVCVSAIMAYIYSVPGTIEYRGGVIKIGLITPLTGQYAMFGEVNKNATQMAEEYFGTSTVQVYIEDDAYDSKKAVSAYKKLRAINDIRGVIVLGAPSIQAIKPLSDADNIPLFGLGTTLVYEKDSVFQLMPPGDNMMSTAGKIYSKAYQRIAIVHSNAELFKLYVANLMKGVDPEDVVYKTEIPAENDYRTEVVKMLQTKPEVVTIALPLQETIKFIKALNVLDPDKKVKILCDFQTELAVKDYIDAGGVSRIDGCISASIPETAKQEFKDAYKNEFGIDMQITGDFTYDAVGIFVDLANKYNSMDWVEKLSDGNYEYTGVSGEIRFNNDGTRIDQDPKISIFKNGKFEVVK